MSKDKIDKFCFAGGVTKSGNHLVIFPDNYRFHEVLESDLQLVVKYYVSVVPQATDQVSQTADYP